MADPTTSPSGSFLDIAGLQVDSVEVDGLQTVVHGHLTVDARHHTPWGIVHGGVWCTAVETVATIGACAVVEADGRFAVGVDNLTDFLRPVREGLLTIQGRPVQIGRSLQLWSVTISAGNGKAVATGRVRLANQDLPAG